MSLTLILKKFNKKKTFFYICTEDWPQTVDSPEFIVLNIKGLWHQTAKIKMISSYLLRLSDIIIFQKTTLAELLLNWIINFLCKMILNYLA